MLRTLILLIGAPAVGVALGLVALVVLVLPNMQLGDVQRIIELGRHLQQDSGSPRLVFLGDSVLRDGIDADLVRDAAPRGWTAENLGLSGCGLNERGILLPRLLATEPAAVAIGLSVNDLCDGGAVGADKGYAYAYAGFVDPWLADARLGDFPGLTTETWVALGSSRLSQWFHFRTVPANWVDYRLRLATRSDLRSGHETDWIHPYTRTGSIRGARLDRHLAQTRRGLLDCGDRDWGDARNLTNRLAGQIVGANARLVVVLVPMHPALQDDAVSVLERLKVASEEIATRHAGILVDATMLLDAEEFSDALHPNAEGRARFSAQVGRALPLPHPGTEGS